MKLARLFDPAEHEPLTTSHWDARHARSGIDRIVEATVRHDHGRAADRDSSLWIGAAGVLWALDRLGASPGECGLYDSYLAQPDLPGAGLMHGEAGVLLVSWRLAPTHEKEERLFELVAGNLGNPENELFNGVPGTMLAALHVYETTGDERWRTLWLACADDVWERFRVDPELGCRIWIQYRRGRLIRSIGAGHGFASNAHSLLRGDTLLGAERTAELQRSAAETAAATAQHQDGLVNWPTAADPYWADQFATRVQWCHGAPGMLTSLAALPRDERTNELFEEAGELIWKAGPLKKGAGLCHGTAGNGCAFLALYARTGEERWLDRARAFATHALEQVERSEPRYSLWTGEIGVALYLGACLDGWNGMPILDWL
jgi:lantibiotic modifying enzyme